MPVSILEGGPWPHPSRLPLGAGWQGHCTAPGAENQPPADSELHDGCNLGYASKCPRLPIQRDWDAIRLSVATDNHDRVVLRYVCERQHLLAAWGKVEFDLRAQSWITTHPDLRVQAMAACYLESYLQRRTPPQGFDVA